MNDRNFAITRRLTPADLAGAMVLKSAANWNQTEADWLRAMEVEPDGCLCIECDGMLAASATIVTYARELAWIGMVLTHPDYRRRGFARLLMEQALEYADNNGIAWVKLDATDSGAPLYGQLGFEGECSVERWLREPGQSFGTEPAPGPFEPDPELDMACFGADRSRLLCSFARDGAASARGGFAMGRPGSNAAYFGPCTARTPEAARALLSWFCRAHSGEAIFWDILPDNAAAVELARDYGFKPVRRLIRMLRKGAAARSPFRWDPSGIFAIAGFEYG